MAQPKETQRLAEVEYCLSSYFNTHFVPIMTQERSKLQSAQAKEYADYTTSFAGIMRQMANASNPYAIDDTMQYLRLTGKENSKTAEDYVGACKDRILGDMAYEADLLRMAGEWRNAIVAQIGREKYDQLSKSLGADLALAYVDYRVEQMMIDRMVKEQMPKSSFDYVLRKGASASLFGLQNELLKSPLQAEIEARGEAAYKPSGTEKVAARGVTMAADAVAFGGVYSWAGLARLAGTEVVFAGLETVLDKKGKTNGMTVEECISQGVFGSKANVFPAIRQQAASIKSYENSYVQSVNQSLSKKMPLLTEKPAWMMDFNLNPMGDNQLEQTPFFKPMNTGNGERNEKYKDVPMVVAPGQEQAYLDDQAEQERKRQEATKQASEKEESKQEDPQETEQETAQSDQQEEGNEDGWANLLQSVGLNGISDIGRNLPYVIAMLPDMLIGLFTGKTTSVNMKKDMIPLASILLGMFVKNPLLKMVLIGMGGANLLNKMGHEAIDREMGIQPKATQYKQYADEELNPRIVNPILKGNTLIATIDNVPCSVTIPDNAAAAYAAGALPLNTLANAILARHDQMKTLSESNYRNVEITTEQQQERGIVLR